MTIFLTDVVNPDLLNGISGKELESIQDFHGLLAATPPTPKQYVEAFIVGNATYDSMINTLQDYFDPSQKLSEIQAGYVGQILGRPVLCPTLDRALYRPNLLARVVLEKGEEDGKYEIINYLTIGDVEEIAENLMNGDEES